MIAKDTVMNDKAMARVLEYERQRKYPKRKQFNYEDAIYDDEKAIAKAQAKISFKAGVSWGVKCEKSYRHSDYKAGIKEVVELVDSCKMRTDVHQEDGSLFVTIGDISILKEYWQAKLKEWGIH